MEQNNNFKEEIYVLDDEWNGIDRDYDDKEYVEESMIRRIEALAQKVSNLSRKVKTKEQYDHLLKMYEKCWFLLICGKIELDIPRPSPDSVS